MRSLSKPDADDPAFTRMLKWDAVKILAITIVIAMAIVLTPYIMTKL